MGKDKATAHVAVESPPGTHYNSIADLPKLRATTTKESNMRHAVAAVGILVFFCGIARTAAEPAKEAPSAPSRLCVVWTSAAPEVAKNVCFMYTGNAKKRGWFDEVHLVVWGPSAKLLAGNQQLQAEVAPAAEFTSGNDVAGRAAGLV